MYGCSNTYNGLLSTCIKLKIIYVLYMYQTALKHHVTLTYLFSILYIYICFQILLCSYVSFLSNFYYIHSAPHAIIY